MCFRIILNWFIAWIVLLTMVDTIRNASPSVGTWPLTDPSSCKWEVSTLSCWEKIWLKPERNGQLELILFFPRQRVEHCPVSRRSKTSDMTTYLCPGYRGAIGLEWSCCLFRFVIWLATSVHRCRVVWNIVFKGMCWLPKISKDKASPCQDFRFRGAAPMRNSH